MPEFRQFLIGDIGQQLKVRQDKLVLDSHNLTIYPAMCNIRRLSNADVVPQALAHLLAAIGPHQQGGHKALLGRLPHHGLELPAHQEVKLLVSAAKLNIRLYRHRVVGLEQRVEQFGQGNRAPLVISLAEVISGQKLGDGKLAGKPDNIAKVKIVKPLALPPYLGLFPVNYLEKLLHIGIGISSHLLRR